MKKKEFYRVCNVKTQQGLWYDFVGKFTGLIHDRFCFCSNNTLTMPFDDCLVGWLSCTDTLTELLKWFSISDIQQLEKHGYTIAMYSSKKYKRHENHWIIEQKSAKLKVELQTSDIYTCAVCHETFEKGWSDEEAEEELKGTFGVPKEECGVVCDDCYKKMMKPQKKIRSRKMSKKDKELMKAYMDCLIYGSSKLPNGNLLALSARAGLAGLISQPEWKEEIPTPEEILVASRKTGKSTAVSAWIRSFFNHKE